MHSTVPKLLPMVFATMLTSCASAKAPTDVLMDDIEAKVQLPQAQYRLADYSRTYAYSGDQMVIGHYLVPSDPIPADAGCSEMTVDGKLVPCSSETREHIAERRTRELKAGERRWIDDVKGLPFIMDGGCLMITVEYDLRKSEVTSVDCNGEA